MEESEQGAGTSSRALAAQARLPTACASCRWHGHPRAVPPGSDGGLLRPGSRDDARPQASTRAASPRRTPRQSGRFTPKRRRWLKDLSQRAEAVDRPAADVRPAVTLFDTNIVPKVTCNPTRSLRLQALPLQLLAELPFDFPTPLHQGIKALDHVVRIPCRPCIRAGPPLTAPCRTDVHERTAPGRASSLFRVTGRTTGSRADVECQKGGDRT